MVAPAYVAPAERLAAFDNDGTLWSEKPIPIQLDFTLYRMAQLVDANPALKEHRPALRLIVLHDDHEREFDYTAGAGDALQRAQDRGWTVASMRTDWSTVFPES
jgi:hypothetical protein